MLDFTPLTIAYADASQSTSTAQPTLLENLVPFVVVFVVMYFLIIRPQAKKTREQADLLKNLKPGDEVATSGGLIGKIKQVSDEFVSIDLGSTTVKVLKENISRYTKKTVSNKA